MSIRVLSDQLTSQIAAGEVVERPSSVVKELVENSLDAGATSIYVEVREGGRQLMQVADDGTGIAAQEVEVAFKRHATSKLSQVEDLQAIESLGFRGEALAAIAAVSKVTVVSRTDGESAGTRLVLEAGIRTAREQVGAPRGTVVAVENLFYNVPARLKFLKSANTERRLFDEFVTRYALAYPRVRFRLTHNGRVTFQTSGNGSMLDVLLAIYGPETAQQLLEVVVEPESDDWERAGASESGRGRASIGVSGYVGPPSLHWSNRSHITLFVNGRWIKDTQLTYAVIQAYHTLLPTGRYPLGVIFLTLPPQDVDVNVHPAKTEVRFRQGKVPFGSVQRAVRQTLIDSAPIRHLGAWPEAVSRPSLGWSGTLDGEAFARRAKGPDAQLDFEWPRHAPDSLPPAPEAPDPPEQFGGEKLPIMRVVGQVGAAYIITEGPEGMYLIDQHAAHERILFEKFMAERDGRGVASQGLVTGAAVYLTPSQAALLSDQLPVLSQLGFEIEPFGPNAFMVRAVPALLVKQDPALALTAVIEDLERGDAPLQGSIEASVILRVCKTAAVKAGQTLAMAEMEALVQQLEACQSPYTCPHGRPTMIHLSATQLAREFGRT